MPTARNSTVESEKRPLDRTDRQILDILQREGRIAISELAGRVNLTTTPCAERVKRLERDGVITGYHARVNPQAVGKDLLVFLEISLSAKSGDVFEKVRRELMQVPEVLECHLVSGAFDYLVKARLSEMRAYRKLLGELLKRLPGSASSHSYVVMEELKETLYIPLS